MDRTKYPRTMNLPWSGSESSDDVWWKDATAFDGKEVVVTEKMDGEATSIYPDGHVHARSIDTRHHDSRSWVKRLAASIAHDIPEGYRICGENVFAWHSIFYIDLPTYFFVYGIYDGDLCLSWDDVKDDIVLLLYHSDCVGELTSEQCAKVAPRLRELIGDWPDKMAPFKTNKELQAIGYKEEYIYDDYDKKNALLLADQMEECVRFNVPLIFC